MTNLHHSSQSNSPTVPQLTVLSIVPDRDPETPWSPAYRVTGGKAPHRVTLDPPTCDCADFTYKGVHKPTPTCKHLSAVRAWILVEPQAALLDGLSEKQTLDVIDPSNGNHYTPRTPFAIDLEDRAVAITALEKWGELRRLKLKQKPNGYYSLWRAACEAMKGLECEKGDPSHAAEHFAISREWVRNIGTKGRVA